MLADLSAQPADELLALIKLHADDLRPDKIDLGVGVYRNESGKTPVFAAVKEAERRLVETQESKSYLGPEGDMGFVRALMPWVFGTDDRLKGGRIEGMQTPGGTGAIRLAAALARKADCRQVWMGSPSWPNHGQIFEDLGFECKPFLHSTERGSVNMEALREAVAEADVGDAVLLHGCCHNPTGIDYSPTDWDEIAEMVADKGLLPILDLAYQGLGHSMEDDAYGVRRVLAAVPEALVAYSCDKNFGLYRDRVGAVYIMTESAVQTASAISNCNALARACWSMPPDHGGAVARIVLENTELTDLWQDELRAMRDRMRQVRSAIAAAGQVGAINLAELPNQNGLFAMLPLSAAQISRLRTEHGIYMAGSGRINVAGLTAQKVDAFVAALKEVVD